MLFHLLPRVISGSTFYRRVLPNEVNGQKERSLIKGLIKAINERLMGMIKLVAPLVGENRVGRMNSG